MSLEALYLQAPALVVVVPLLAAPILFLLGTPRLTGLLCFVVAAIQTLFAASLVAQTLDGSVIVYSLGNWAAPVGIEYRIDLLSAVMATLIATSSALVAWFLPTTIQDDIYPADRARFYTAFLLCGAGLTGIVITGDLFNVFVFLEISSLSTYVLIASGAARDRRALTAAFDYLILGAVGATFFVIGIAFLYVVTGTLNMADMGERLPGAGRRAVVVGGAFLFVGLALKAAMAPLHRWLPNAYAYAPSGVSTFLAMTATKVAIYLMLRLSALVFGANGEIGRVNFSAVLPPVGLAMLLFGSALAVRERDLKRLLAYSSIANLGLMLVAIGLGGVAGIAAAMINLINHAIIKGGMFTATAAVVHRHGHARFEALAGLARTMPFTFFCLVAGGLALIGVPLTAGFISKLSVIRTAIDLHHWFVAGGILVTSLITVAYVWRIVEAGMLGAPSDDTRRDAPVMLIIPMAILTTATIALGIDSSVVITLSERIALQLTGGTP